MANIANQTETPKLKIKKTITEQRDIDLEVHLPYFCKFNDYTFIKVIENGNAITVADFGFEVTIKVSQKVNEYFLPDSHEITREEFNQAYETALTKIQSQTL